MQVHNYIKKITPWKELSTHCVLSLNFVFAVYCFRTNSSLLRSSLWVWPVYFRASTSTKQKKLHLLKNKLLILLENKGKIFFGENVGHFWFLSCRLQGCRKVWKSGGRVYLPAKTWGGAVLASDLPKSGRGCPPCLSSSDIPVLNDKHSYWSHKEARYSSFSSDILCSCFVIQVHVTIGCLISKLNLKNKYVHTQKSKTRYVVLKSSILSPFFTLGP